jgi:hypothetical protein
MSLSTCCCSDHASATTLLPVPCRSIWAPRQTGPLQHARLLALRLDTYVDSFFLVVTLVLTNVLALRWSRGSSNRFALWRMYTDSDMCSISIRPNVVSVLMSHILASADMFFRLRQQSKHDFRKTSRVGFGHHQLTAWGIYTTSQRLLHDLRRK